MVDRDERHFDPDKIDIAGEEKAERGNELDRLISLSDGVFAFAMTLLVVSVEVPNMPDAEARRRLNGDLFENWPQIVSYVIGFLVIGFLWGSHRRIFARVKDYDDRLVKLNIVLLMFIAFLPFPTEVLGEYGELAIASIFYAVILAVISLLYILIIDHLDLHRGLMTRGGDKFDFPRAKARHLVTAGVFLLSIPVSLLAPGIGQFTWLLLGLNHQITERLLPILPKDLHLRRSQS